MFHFIVVDNAEVFSVSAVTCCSCQDLLRGEETPPKSLVIGKSQIIGFQVQ